MNTYELEILNKLQSRTWRDDTSNLIVNIHGDTPKIIYPKSFKYGDGVDGTDVDIEIKDRKDVDIEVEIEENDDYCWNNIDENMINTENPNLENLELDDN